MATPPHENEVDPEVEALDSEISALKEEAAALRKSLQVGLSTILSSAPARQQLQATTRQTRSSAAQELADRTARQHAHIHQCLHRISSPITTFKVHDPDPKAVDGGHVLGLRFEVLLRGQFLRPYYVMLNRPFSNSNHLRVHRHTIPPAIPLGGLAARHLPAPPRNKDNSAKQDLERFVRALRREIARYHNRLGVSADLRRGLHKQVTDGAEADGIAEVGLADVEAKQIKLTWMDERYGRLVMDDDGNVVKVAVFNQQGRDWETGKELLGEGQHIDEVVKRFGEFTA